MLIFSIFLKKQNKGFFLEKGRMSEDNKKGPKRTTNYSCELCHYFTSHKTKYNLHLLTMKHKKACEDNKKDQKGQLLQKNYFCKCGNSYVFQSGLTKHKKKCASHAPAILPQKLQEIENKSQDLIHTQIVYNDKRTFNVNVFLNEKCKDAMSITSFIETINPSLKELENVGEKGYVKGISSIILSRLQKLDIYTRPIHNLKKEIYVKEQEWEKGEQKVVKFVKNVALKNMRNISEWKIQNPEYENIKSGKNTQFLKIVKECTWEDEKTQKIVQNISKKIS
jgi:hypothetical protein